MSTDPDTHMDPSEPSGPPSTPFDPAEFQATGGWDTQVSEPEPEELDEIEAQLEAVQSDQADGDSPPTPWDHQEWGNGEPDAVPDQDEPETPDGPAAAEAQSTTAQQSRTGEDSPLDSENTQTPSSPTKSGPEGTGRPGQSPGITGESAVRSPSQGSESGAQEDRDRTAAGAGTGDGPSPDQSRQSLVSTTAASSLSPGLGRAETRTQTGPAGEQVPRRSRGPEEIERLKQLREKARREALENGPSANAAGPAGSPPRAMPPGRPAPGPGARPPHLDPRTAAAEQQGGPPPWLGTRWRDIPPEQQRDAWVGLRRWVDWLVNEFKLPTQVVPACWYRHPNLVQELYAAMCMEQKAWEEAAASLTPMMMWHPNLQAMIMRLREMVQDLAGCAKGQHKEPEQVTLDYDESLWRATVYGLRTTTTVTRPRSESDQLVVRARLVGDEDEQVAESENLVGVTPVRGADDPTVVLQPDRIPGAEETIIQLTAESVPEGATVAWEKATSWELDPQGAVAAANWKPVDAPAEDDEGGSPARPGRRGDRPRG